MRRVSYALVAGALALGLGTPAASAATTHEKDIVKNGMETFVDELPCVGQARITIVFNAQFHFTENANGTHVTGTTTGTFVADPLAAGAPTYRGRFTQWFGENSNRRTTNGTFTFSVRARGDDGSRIMFHQVAHFNVVNGDVKVEFDKTRCA